MVNTSQSTAATKAKATEKPGATKAKSATASSKAKSVKAKVSAAKDEAEVTKPKASTKAQSKVTKPKATIKEDPVEVTKTKTVAKPTIIATPKVTKTPKSKAGQKQEETQAVEVEIEKIEELEDAPLYSLNETTDPLHDVQKTISFHKIVAHEGIVGALDNANFKQTNENVQRILQSVLRGSDVFACIENFDHEFLIAGIGSAYKVLSGALTRAEAKHPVTLIIANDEKKLSELFSSTSKVFAKLGIQFSLLSTNNSEQEKKDLLEKHIDVLFATAKSLEEAHKSLGLNLNSIGLCVVYDLQNILSHNSASFYEILKLLPKERVQKVFLTTENTPKTRELSFHCLDDLEYFYLLPCYVKERQPKQFAHALTTTQKFQVLLGHLKHHKPACAAVFANTRSVAEWIAYKLHGNGIKVELITTSLNFAKKQQLLKAIKSGETNIIVTTDYHTTSLGIEDLNCLYHFDLPDTAEKFVGRLNLIEKAKSPISVSFICEDYGYNMGQIEDKLGFKIHVANPDKEYFNLKDTSDYPLEADGRVKRIGQVQAQPSVQTQPQAQAQKPAVVQTHTSVAQPHTSQAQIAQPHASHAQAAQAQDVNFMPRSNVENNKQQQQHQPRFDRKPHEKFEHKFKDKQYDNRPQDKFENKYQDKFIRRDEKAKEALDAARMAAQERRNAAAQKQQQTTSSNKNILSLAVYMVQDALKAATTAAKQSLTNNLEQNMPMFTGILNKIPFLKKEKDK